MSGVILNGGERQRAGVKNLATTQMRPNRLQGSLEDSSSLALLLRKHSWGGCYVNAEARRQTRRKDFSNFFAPYVALRLGVPFSLSREVFFPFEQRHALGI